MSGGRRRYVYGPAPSRRLGRSLGVDLIPYKTCSYDCVYCQIGRTTRLTVERARLAPETEVLAQVAEALARGPRPDVITLGGSGEPTLHAGLGEVIRQIKAMTDAPVAVLTNGSLLFRPEVRAELMAADVVVPDLDAGSAEAFVRVCRPHPDLHFERVGDGLVEFAREFTGRLLVEVFLVGGVNDGAGEVGRIADLVSRMPGARAQLNTVTRPPADSGVAAVPAARLAELARLFDPPAEVIADFKAPDAEPSRTAITPDDVLAMLRRRPCTAHDLAQGLAVSPDLVLQLLSPLLESKKIIASEQEGRTYYVVA